MTTAALRVCVGLTIWGVALLASLSNSKLRGAWGHGLCGPWGCGPPLQALVSCHLTWLVALAPAAGYLIGRHRRIRRNIGLVLAVLSIGILLAGIAYQRFVWWPGTSQWQQTFFWQHCAFPLVTAVEFPIVQTLAIGLVLLAWPRVAGQSGTMASSNTSVKASCF